MDGKVRGAMRLGGGDSPLFELYDDKGEARIFLGVFDFNGSPLLELKDEKGVARVRMTLYHNSFDKASPRSYAPRLDMADDKGTVRAGMRLDADGSPHLALRDKENKNRAGLFLFSDGCPWLSLQDKGGDIRARLSVESDGHPVLQLHSSVGKSLAMATLDVKADGSPGLRLTTNYLGAEGDEQIALAVKPNGVPALSLRDKEGKMRAVLGRTGLENMKTGEETTTAESSLTLFDKEGKVLWKAP
jgi:hypothetical protein